ncbi:MAG: DUF2336 domain-containing protein [Alphaproteobacteria bacterium]|nr:DUF2336 domain-containing protein [Alphaproteobacteria bacterium]MBV9372067.1 DUF2336 domain-containing protein [Alphaproteobacteria bacterium]MBV9901094.1 DUF2336 domain-containing protein [Alphaproteobacteria bacterium]
MSDRRPSGGKRDGAAELLASARARVSAAAADLALPEPLRLSEQQRSLVTRLLADLVRTIEDELRARLLPAFEDEAVRAALGSAHLPIAASLIEARDALADEALVGALLRRAEEHRLEATADHRLLASLAGDRDEAVAAEAMSLLILQNARRDAFGEPLVGASGLPAEIQHRLVWRIAAALRAYLVRRQGVAAGAADRAVAAAVGALLAGHDEGEGVDARALRLAKRLAEAGRLDDGLFARLAVEAGLPLLLAALAVRSGLGAGEAWQLLAERGSGGATALLRAAGVGRSAAAAILLQLGVADDEVARRLEAYEALPAAEAEAVLIPWRADPAYRAAILEIGG